MTASELLAMEQAARAEPANGDSFARYVLVLVEELRRCQLTLRDQFACSALIHSMTSEDGPRAARDAYRIADAMLEVRNSPPATGETTR